MRVAREDDTDVADPVVAAAANPTMVNDCTVAVVVPTELVASKVK